MKRLMGLMVVVAAAACGTEGNAQVDAIAGLTGDVENGEALYVAQCQTCHGADARSGSANEDLAGEIGEETSEFIGIILEGKDNGAMPAFADVLSDQEIADIVAYIEGL